MTHNIAKKLFTVLALATCPFLNSSTHAAGLTGNLISLSGYVYTPPEFDGDWRPHPHGDVRWAVTVPTAGLEEDGFFSKNYPGISFDVAVTDTQVIFKNFQGGAQPDKFVALEFQILIHTGNTVFSPDLTIDSATNVSNFDESHLRHDYYPSISLNLFDLIVDPQSQIVLNVSAVPWPVPEPSTFAMLLAGLGLVGFAARRKRMTE
jgi:hypothetical protein